MELITSYLEIDQPRRVDYHHFEAQPEWLAFHESTEHKISVFAGRGMGKTYNLALRAAHSQYDCEIFAAYPGAAKLIFDAIVTTETAVAIEAATSAHSLFRIKYINGRRITIRNASRNLSDIYVQRFTNKEVMFDEFEHSSFDSFVNELRFLLNQARHVVCVGSLRCRENSMAKRWFKDSGTKCFIDAPYAPATRGHQRYEYFPSEMRQMIEHLPSENTLTAADVTADRPSTHFDIMQLI